MSFLCVYAFKTLFLAVVRNAFIFMVFVYQGKTFSYLVGWLTFIYIFICEVRKIEAVYFELGYLTYVAVLVVF